MNPADGIILVIIAISALLSLKRGFTREAFSLASWVAAFIIARLFGPGLEVLLESSIETASVRTAVSFGLLFVATLAVGAMINHLVGEVVRMTGLTSTDRMLGMVFGALRGAILMIVAVALAKHVFMQDAWWNESALIPHLVMMEDWTRKMAASLLDWIMGVGV